jgi:hypothetical protein
MPTQRHKLQATMQFVQVNHQRLMRVQDTPIMLGTTAHLPKP